MIIVLLLFFKSICLFCQRLVLYIYDGWINPTNARILKEAIEAKGTRLGYEEYIRRQEQHTHPKKRRIVTNSHISGAGGSGAAVSSIEYCRFCINTPQGYCRHHFHLQELHVHQLQQQKHQNSLWYALGKNLGKSIEWRQLRKIKRQLKYSLHQQQPSLKRSQEHKFSRECGGDISNNCHDSQSFNFNRDSVYPPLLPPLTLPKDISAPATTAAYSC